MIRLIIIIVVGLIAGIGGGTGFAVVSAKKTWTNDSTARRILAESLAVHNDSLTSDSAKSHGADSTHGATKPAGAHVDSAHASTTKDSAHVAKDSSAVVHKGKDSAAVVAKPGSKNAEVAAAPIVLPPKPLIVSRPGASAPAGTGPAVPAVMPTKKIARIFAAMPPKEASRVLEQLDDSDVRTILSSLNEKQAASILSNFPPQRAATISKAAMRAARTTP